MTYLEIFLVLYVLPTVTMHYAVFLDERLDSSLRRKDLYSENFEVSTNYPASVLYCYLPFVNILMFIVGTFFALKELLPYLYTKVIKPILSKRIF